MSNDAFTIHNANGQHPVVLVCEHASALIPQQDRLGLDKQAATSHIAWDPGAVATARILARLLDSVLVEGGVSRLLYDLNRPPESPTAIPERSEIYEIPGNTNLDAAARAQRVNAYYQPFTAAVGDVLQNHHCTPVLVTIHSFTKVYNGVARDVEIGILHDTDKRLADSLLKVASGYTIRRNEPYGPQDGVCHTLQLHGIQNQLHNVMIEIRNDLIVDDNSCERIAGHLASWINTALNDSGALDTQETPS